MKPEGRVWLSLCLLLLAGHGSQSAQGNNGEQAPRSSQPAMRRGEDLFTRYCAACHNFETAEIGPNLAGVTTARRRDWLVSFIRDAPQRIASGDKTAVQLHAQYKQYMPAFPMLTDRDIEDVLAYLETFAAAPRAARPLRSDPLIDPIPERVAASGLTLVLERVLTVPASSDQPPVTRINKLSAVRGSRGDRLFVHDLRGKLYEITGRTTHVFLDVAAEFPRFTDVPGLGTGFGSFAFHPGFEHNGLFYTTHTEPAGSARADFPLPETVPVRLQWVLTEWKAERTPARAFAGVHRELLRADMHSHVHGFQELTFNPLAHRGDAEYGLLYLGVGDGGSGASQYSHVCCTTGIWGTVLRIDPAGQNSKNGKYGIPGDNPFRNPAEVWARGFRNPHRIAWDLTGSRKMFITDIGHHSIEEVNLGVAGTHYGWPAREGTFVFDNANPKAVYPRPANDAVPYAYPVVQFDHDDGNAVSGGFVSPGDAIPLLRGKYVFGDITRGKIFYAEVASMKQGRQAPIYEFGLEVDGERTSLETVTRNKRVDLRFGQDANGILYVFTKADGTLWRVADCKRQ
jgi:mono/diheme cytochrome c family protein